MDDRRESPKKTKRRPRPATMAEVAEKEGEQAGLVIRDFKQLLETVEKELVDHIEQNHAALTERDVKSVISKIANRPDILPQKVAKAVEIDKVLKLGRDSFSRILVERFEKLLYEPDGRSLKQGALPRKFIPGFLEAVRLLLGVEHYDELRVTCSKMVEAKQSSRADLTTSEFWKDLYESPEARLISADVYCRVGAHFANFDRRKGWFINVVNDYIESNEGPSAGKATKRWRMRETHFVEMFTRIYLTDTRQMKLADDLKKYIDLNFDAEQKEKIEKLLTALRSDVRRVLSTNRAVGR